MPTSLEMAVLAARGGPQMVETNSWVSIVLAAVDEGLFLS